MGAWRHRGQGPVYVKIGKLVFYRPSDIRAYVASRSCGQRNRRDEQIPNHGELVAAGLRDDCAMYGIIPDG